MLTSQVSHLTWWKQTRREARRSEMTGPILSDTKNEITCLMIFFCYRAREKERIFSSRVPFFPSLSWIYFSSLISDKRAVTQRGRKQYTQESFERHCPIYDLSVVMCACARARETHVYVCMYIRVRKRCDNAGRYPTHIMQFSRRSLYFYDYKVIPGAESSDWHQRFPCRSIRPTTRADNADDDATRKESTSSTISLGGKKLHGCLPHDRDDKKCVASRDYRGKLTRIYEIAERERSRDRTLIWISNSCDSYTSFSSHPFSFSLQYYRSRHDYMQIGDGIYCREN